MLDRRHFLIWDRGFADRYVRQPSESVFSKVRQAFGLVAS